MDQKRLGIIQIVHALLFAAAILFSARVLADTGHQQTISALLIALWLASSVLLTAALQSRQCEWACIWRFFGLRR